MRVLMVEDFSADAELIEREARKVLPDARFMRVQTREDYLSALESFSPGLILSDYRMPRFDGMSALRLSLVHAPETPFIIITGSMNEDTAVECMKGGAWDYVIKEHLKRLGPAILSSLEQKELRRERMMAQRALRESEARYRSILELAPVGVIVHAQGKIVFVNPAAVRLMRAGDERGLLGKPIKELIHPDYAKLSLLPGMTAEAKDLFPAEAVFVTLDGAAVLVEVTASRLVYNNEDAVQFIVSDITRRKEYEKELMHVSRHDQLTGIYNRPFFEEEIRRLEAECASPVTVILCDVNGLKIINDSFGHMEGDELLRQAASVIAMEVRPGDIVARVGGDEFAVLLPNTAEAEAEAISARIRSRMKGVTCGKVVLSISLGHATRHTPAVSMRDVLAEAENNMYRHKIYESASMRNKTVDVVLNALFEKSKREMLHSRRVSVLGTALAAELGLKEHEVNRIRMFGLVHDIGKIGIDEKILNKPARLDEAEWAEMRKHPEVGWRILTSASEFSELAEFVLCHHERWDGGGYPKGLKGREIPLEARIINVADSYDAMTKDRAYRKGMSPKEAIEELKRNAGTQFDPLIVDVMIHNILERSAELTV